MWNDVILEMCYKGCLRDKRNTKLHYPFRYILAFGQRKVILKYGKKKKTSHIVQHLIV